MYIYDFQLLIYSFQKIHHMNNSVHLNKLFRSWVPSLILNF